MSRAARDPTTEMSPVMADGQHFSMQREVQGTQCESLTCANDAERDASGVQNNFRRKKASLHFHFIDSHVCLEHLGARALVMGSVL